jgi:hypothetical protein
MPTGLNYSTILPPKPKSEVNPASRLANVGDAESKRLRRLALEWISQELAEWRNHLANATEETRTKATRTLALWQHDPALAPIRDAPDLRALSEKERRRLNLFWIDVDDLHHQLITRPRPRLAPSAN